VEGDDVKMMIENLTDRRLYFGTDYKVERRTDNGWKDLTSKLAWTLPLLGLEPHERSKAEPLYLNEGETFTAGDYRVSKRVSFNDRSKDEFTVTAEFTVEPAPAAAAVLHLEPEEPAEGESITVRIENVGDKELTYGQSYSLERQEDKVWKSVLLDDMAFEDIGYELQPGDNKVGWTLRPLIPGTYRFTTDVYHGGSTRLEHRFTVTAADPIEVSEPTEGEVLISPFTVSGTANVFEANVSIRVLDENGEVVGETFATATCGSGCRGDYETPVEFEVDRRQPGTVEVYEVSAETGEPMNVVSIPVILSPEKS
jgi:hypothetical protein